MAKADSPPNLDAILDAMTYLYAESRRVTRVVAEQYGLTGAQLVILRLLSLSGRLSLSDISDRIRAKNSTVTGIIDRMERDGLVARRRSDDDRRVIHIELTRKGAALATEAAAAPTHLFRQSLEWLPDKDAAELERIITKLARRVRDALGELGEKSLKEAFK